MRYIRGLDGGFWVGDDIGFYLQDGTAVPKALAASPWGIWETIGRGMVPVDTPSTWPAHDNGALVLRDNRDWFLFQSTQTWA